MLGRIIAAIRQFDWVLFAAVISLLLIGLAVIGSVSLSQIQPDFNNLIKQGVAATIGLVAVFVLGSINYRAFEPAARLLYVGGIVVMILVLIFGQTIRGTQGWFVVGNWSFQPVEFAKIILVIFLARYFSRHAMTRDFRSVIGSGLGALLFVGLTFLQPDFGSSMVLLALWLALLLISGTKRKYVALILGAALLTAVLGWSFALKPYQQERVLTFLDPARDPLGRGYNLTQSLIAVGAGGWFGRGLGFGSQSQLRFLPEAQTDFIFAVVAEELGFLAVCVVLSLYLLVIWRAMRLARLARDNFTAFLTTGIAVLLTVQIFVNIGMNMGLMPITGIALPFLSYGGSSLVMSLVLIGLLQSVAVRVKTTGAGTIDVREREW